MFFTKCQIQIGHIIEGIIHLISKMRQDLNEIYRGWKVIFRINLR